MSKKHGEFRRPEITRENDLLAQDQRRIIEFQRKKLEHQDKQTRTELVALINSKIFANIQNNVDSCLKFCKKGGNKILLQGGNLDSPFKRLNIKEENLIDGVDINCLDYCVKKKNESYKMLLLYFFEKMKRDEDKRDDFESLYDVPEKFKKINL